jgi:hypothetical protein
MAGSAGAGAVRGRRTPWRIHGGRQSAAHRCAPGLSSGAARPYRHTSLNRALYTRTQTQTDTHTFITHCPHTQPAACACGARERWVSPIVRWSSLDARGGTYVCSHDGVNEAGPSMPVPPPAPRPRPLPRPAPLTLSAAAGAAGRARTRRGAVAWAGVGGVRAGGGTGAGASTSGRDGHAVGSSVAITSRDLLTDAACVLGVRATLERRVGAGGRSSRSRVRRSGLARPDDPLSAYAPHTGHHRAIFMCLCMRVCLCMHLYMHVHAPCACAMCACVAWVDWYVRCY